MDCVRYLLFVLMMVIVCACCCAQHAPRPLLNKYGDWSAHQQASLNKNRNDGPQESNRIYVHNSQLEARATNNMDGTARMSVATNAHVVSSSRESKGARYESLMSSRHQTKEVMQQQQQPRRAQSSSSKQFQQKQQRQQRSGTASSPRSQSHTRRKTTAPTYMQAARGRS